MNRTEVLLPIEAVKLNPRNARTHSKRQIREIAASIEANGFGSSVLVDENHVLIAGQGRLAAMKLLGRAEIPAIVLSGLTDLQKRSLALAENRIALNAGWDRALLAIELPELATELAKLGGDIMITGFSHAEIDELQVDFNDSESPQSESDVLDLRLLDGQAVSLAGDLWHLGNHRLLQGNACSLDDHERLLAGAKAAMACHDVPYNVKIADVVGRGQTKHREFAMASGEMSRADFVNFLVTALNNTRAVLKDGGLAYVFIDWRHVDQLIEAGIFVFDEMINLVCWVKPNPGMGSFYRSAHELIAVFRSGISPSLNNVELGKHGRSRSNVWRYPGATQSGEGRRALKDHPTPKPIALLADAIKDCTRRNDIVLDCFAGSGSTLLAAEKVGRRGYCMEIDGAYVDLAIRRWQTVTGKDAYHAPTGSTFEEIGEERRSCTNPSQTEKEALEPILAGNSRKRLH